MKIQLVSIGTFLLAVSALAGGGGGPGIGDSALATARQTIVAKLQIHKVSDLNFGEASPGEGPKKIDAGTAETRENASFAIEGEPQRAYQIILPARNSVQMVTGPGGADSEITIQEFSSYPAGSGILDRSGKGMIFVGATRAAIRSTQKTGEYMGQFFVTVVY